MKTPRNLRLSWVRTSVLCLIACLCAACGKKEAAQPTGRPPVPVQVATAQAKTVPLYIDTVGQTTAYEAVSIQPQVSGELMQIHFKQGTVVKKGDTLFTIYQPPYQAALDAAKASLLKDEADLSINRKLVERSRALLPQKYVSEQQFQEYEANVAMLEAAIAGDKANILKAQINLDYCTIKAPTDGLIGLYLVNVGNVVSANTSTLTTLRKMDPIYVDFVVPSAQFSAVRTYLENAKSGTLDVQITAQTDAKRTRTAKLRILGNQVAPTSGTVNLRAEMENADFLFWPNEQIKARIILSELPDTVLVPQASVRYNQKGSYVWTVADNTARLSPVEIGQLQDGGFYGLKKGVKAGDIVVTVGSLMLQPGSKVAIVDPAVKEQTSAPAENAAAPQASKPDAAQAQK